MIDVDRYLSKLRLHKDLGLIATAAFLLYLGFGIYAATFNNFAVQTIHIQPDQLGILESLRESPGLVMAFVLALAMHIAEPMLGSAALILIVMGFLGYSHTESFPPIVAYSVLWSIGLHIWMPLQSAMTLSLAEEGKKGKRLGQIGACAGLGNVIGIAAVMVIDKGLSFSSWYLVASCWIGLGAVVIWFVRRDLSPPDKPRLVFKRKYRLYYALTFLEGCRKQVFITFAPYVLVRVYNAPLRTMAFLMLINNLVNLTGAPIVGRMIDKIGERKVLTASYSCLIFVFLGYAFIHKAPVLFVFYCLDSLLYLSTYGITTFLNRIAEERDMVPSLSMGVTMNHLAAVAVPLVGGFMWARFSYPIPFIGGAFVVVASLALAQRVRNPVLRPANENGILLTKDLEH
jgi:MFS family permease